MSKHTACHTPLHIVSRLTTIDMKTLFVLFLLVATTTCLFAQVTASTNNAPVAQWNETTHQFGKVPQDVPVSFEFKVTNTGTVPLQIYGVERACGCTTPEWTSKAIQPGTTGVVKVVFDAKTGGFFSKTIKVLLNTDEGSAELLLTGEVLYNSKM